MQNGWVKLHRKILENPLLHRDNNCYIVFTKLLLRVDKNTGSYQTGRFMLAELTRLKPTTAYAALKRLERSKIVSLSSDNKMTTIYICNWREYQATDDNALTTSRQQDDTKQEKRIKNKENNISIGSKTSKTKNEELFFDLVRRLGLTDKTQFLPERKAKLNKRLERYKASSISTAADNLAADDFMMGRSEKNSTRYATIDYLLRSDLNVDKWLNVAEDKGYKDWSKTDLTQVEVPIS